MLLTLIAVNFLVKFSLCNIDYDINDDSGFGRQFEGIGAISGGGATSKLLINYPGKQRNEILDFLFKPNFGASLHILKVEIGGDGQSTDGTEASHMHTSSDENYYRGYEWWLMAEAKKRNPSIKLYGLPWTFPGWLGETPYDNNTRTADYVTRWIKGAKRVHGFTIDYIGIWNERMYNKEYIEILRSMLDQEGFSHVQIVAADVKWEVADDILKDQNFSSAISKIGCHYPGTQSTRNALLTNKPLWSSEDFSTYNDDVGAGCLARILNQNFVNGNMTSTIAWNLIASYYQDLPYTRDGLMTADQPWSGHYTVNNPIWITAHTTQFVLPGWRYLKHGHGSGHLNFGGSYVSLVDGAGNLTIIIETMTWAQSMCIRPFIPYYDVQVQKIVLNLKGSFSRIKEFNVWVTKILPHDGDIIFKRMDPLRVVDSKIHLHMRFNEVYTITTLQTGNKGVVSDILKSKPFPLPYADTFQDSPVFSEPPNFAQQMGSFEIYENTTTKEKTLRQMVQQPPIHWCDADTHNVTFSVIGNYQWRNITFAIDANLAIGDPGAKRAEGVYVGVRVYRGGCKAAHNLGLFLFVFPRQREYLLSSDLLRKSVISRGKSNKIRTTWNNISISAYGNLTQGIVNGHVLFTLSNQIVTDSGFAAFGTYRYGLADFRNARITESKPLHRDINTLYYDHFYTRINDGRLFK